MKYKKQKQIISFDIISNVIVEYFELPSKLFIFKKSRKKEIILYRQWFHYFARTLNPEQVISASSIGEYYSDVSGHSYDHATILNSVKKIKGYIDYSKVDQQIKDDILFLIKQKLDKQYKKPLTGNCATQPFQITRFYEPKKPTPTSTMVSH